jgi:hypothetical protein
MAAGERPDRLAGDDRVAGVQSGLDRFVGGPQPVGVRHADDAASGDHAREDDRAGARGSHDSAGRRREIDAAMPGQPGLRRRIEPPDHPRRLDRPAEPTRGIAQHRRPCRAGLRRHASRTGKRSEGQDQGQQKSHARETAAINVSRRLTRWTNPRCG